MNRIGLLKIVNPLIGLLVLNQVVTGMAGDYIPYDVFEVVHFGGGIATGIVAVAHLALNWGWVKSAYGTTKRRSN